MDEVRFKWMERAVIVEGFLLWTLFDSSDKCRRCSLRLNEEKRMLWKSSVLLLKMYAYFSFS